MEHPKLLFVLAILIALLLFVSSTAEGKKYNEKKKAMKPGEQEGVNHGDYHKPSHFFDPKKHHPSLSFEPWNRPRPLLTCDRFPRVCHVRGSPGPDCCRKRCVNVKTDNLNCGICGLRCRYPEICCNGRCVNPLNDRTHCGGCHNKCHRGSVCYYGMCSYA